MNFDSFPQVACLLLALFGLLALALSMRDLWGACQSRSWPATEGEIVHSKVQRFSRRTGSEGNTWTWRIHYEYVLNGTRHKGWRAYYGSEPTLGVARNIVARFPAGAAVKVYYYPKQPGTSVLIPGFNRYTYGGLILALLFFSLMVWLWQYR